MAKSMEEIALILKGMKFKKKMFGVDEADVWRKLEQLQKEYTELIELQKIRYQTLLKERNVAGKSPPSSYTGGDSRG